MGLVIFAFLLFIGLFILLGFPLNKRSFNQWGLKKIQLLSFLSFLVILLGVFSQVNGNEVGIVYNPFKGGIQDVSYSEGLNFKEPWVKVYKISTKLRELNFELSAQTGEIVRENPDGTVEKEGGGQWATYEVILQYRVETSNAHKFYRNFGGDNATVETLQAKVRSALQDNSVKYDVFTILKGGLVNVRKGAEDDLIEILAPLGITVESLIIADVDAGSSIEKVIEEEAIAAKQKEIASKEQEAALIREKTKQLQAEIEAIRVLIEAQAKAEADALLKSVTVNAINLMYSGQFKTVEEKLLFEESIKNDPDALYGYLTIQEISQIVLKQLYYDTWDGVLPGIVLDKDSGIIITP